MSGIEGQPSIDQVDAQAAAPVEAAPLSPEEQREQEERQRIEAEARQAREAAEEAERAVENPDGVADAALAQVDDEPARTVDNVSSTPATPQTDAERAEQSVARDSFDESEMRSYAEFRTELLRASADEPLDADDIERRINESGLDIVMVDELMHGVELYRENGRVDESEIQDATDLDTGLDGPQEETEDLGEAFRDIAENFVNLGVGTTGAASDLARELVRTLRTGRIDTDAFTAIAARFGEAVGIDMTTPEVQDEKEDNIKLDNDTSLRDLFPSLPRDDIPYTREDGSNVVEFHLEGIDNKGDMPNLVRMTVSDPAMLDNSSLENDSVNPRQDLFPSLSEDATVLFEFQTASGGWESVSDNLIADDYEVEEES